MKVRFVDLNKQYHSIKNEIDEAIDRVISNSSFILGKEVENFEQNFADFCQTKYCLGVASGTEALSLALEALGIQSGDEVITQANTFIATVLAISRLGARPILVDCDPEDYTIDVNKIESVITEKTKAIIPVHLYGQPADMNSIIQIAEKHDLTIVEDACQAHGAEINGRRVGSLGKIACFSFYPGKNLGAYGDGGAITTDDPEIAERIRLLRDYGQKKKYYHCLKGYNSRLDALQAAVLDVKLKHLERWNNRRKKNASLYNEFFSGVDSVVCPSEREDVSHIYHLYVIRTDKREEVMFALNEAGIQCGIHYPIPIHYQEAYMDLGYPKGSFPVTERYADEILSLPMFPELSEDEIRTVVNKILSVTGNG